jgi:hypothetical protein
MLKGTCDGKDGVRLREFIILKGLDVLLIINLVKAGKKTKRINSQKPNTT